MKKAVRILLVENAASEIDLAMRAIRASLESCEFQVVENRSDFLNALETFQPDAILADNGLPGLPGMEALDLTLQQAPQTPLVLWTNPLGEETAVDCLKAGANNYVLKENPGRLGLAIRRALEESRKSGEAKYRTLVEHLPAITYISEPNQYMGVTYISPQIEMLGFDANDWLANPELWFRQIHPDDQERVLSEIEKFRSGGKSFNVEYRLQLPNGETRWFHDESRYVRDRDGTPLLKQGFMLDVTERKQTEERMNDLLAFHEKVLNDSPVGILTYKLTGECVFANENAASILGAQVEELKQQNFHRMESWKNSGLYDVVETAIRTREPVTADIYLQSTFRKELWLTVHCVTFRSKEQEHVLLSIADITERKQAEDALRESENRLILALSGAQMSVWEWDFQTNRIFWSPEFFEITGVEEDNAGTFESFTDLIHVDDVARVMAAAEKAMTNNTLFAEEFRIIRPDGEIRWLSNLGHAEYDGTGSHLRLIGTVQDITQRKQAELERQALMGIMQGLAGTRDLQELLKLIHHLIAQVIFAENFFVVLYQPEKGLFEEIYSVDQYDPPAPPAKLEKSITSYVFRSGEPLLLTHEKFEELVVQEEVALVGTNSASWLGVPLKTADRTIGVIVVQDYENTNRYSERERDFLASIAAQIALVIERKRAEEALRESEEHYRAIFEGVQDAIFVEAIDGKILMVNERACEMFGYSQPEFLTKTVYDLVPEGHEILMVGGTADSLSIEPRETINRRANGEIFPIEISGRLQVINGETVLLVVVRDITERKRAEVELRASEERFRQLADNIQEVFWMTDAQTDEEIYISPAAEAIWGRSIEYMLREPNAFIHSVFPEDQPAVLRAIEKEKNGEKVEMEYRIVRPSGSIRWLWDRAFPIFDDTGKVIRLAGITADITERRESEVALIKSQSRYRELFDNSPVSLWEEDYSLVKKHLDTLQANGIVDLKEYLLSHPEEVAQLASLVRIIDANKAALKLYQIEQKEVLLKGLSQILSPDALNHFYEELLGLLSPLQRFTWEGADRMRNGLQVEVIVNGSIPEGYAEDWSKVIVSVSDITERKHAEEEIHRRARETSALLETSLALTNLDLRVTLQTIGNSAKTLFAADGCRIFLMEPDGEFLRCVLALQENFAAFSELKIKLGDGVTGAVAVSGQAEIVNEMQTDPRAVQVAGTPDKEAEAIMFAPLKQGDHTIGVLSIRRAGADRPFDPTDLGLLEAFASMAASAVSNAGLFEETQHRLAELEALYENGLAVGRLLEPREIGNKVIETFARYLRWHHVAIRLKREDSEDIDLVALNMPGLEPAEYVNAAQHFKTRIHKVGQGLSGWVIQTGLPLRTGNVHAYPQYIDTHAGVQSGLYMPLKVGERTIGVISVESETPDAFTDQDERLLATLASQAAIAFENARLYEAIQKELLERKRAEEALRVSETHYRELADSITDILFELDQNLTCIHWNKASEVLIGIPAEAAIGRSMYEIFGETTEQSRIKHIYEDVLQNQQRRTFETVMAWNGQQRSFEINAYPSTRGVSVVAKDVTDRKRSEIIMQKRFELMEYSAHHTLNELMQRTVDEVSELTGSTIGFFHFVEADQNLLAMQTWSTNALRLFNVPIEAGVHLSLDQAGVWADAIRQRHPLIQNDYDSLPKKRGLPEGHVPILREIVIPIIRNERIMAVMGIGNKPQDYTRYDLEIAERLADYAWDITERKQMEVALETERNQLAQRVEERTSDLSRANANLARALRVKDEFLANMSHELRTPLNAILGLSESLGEQIAGPLNEKQQKYITTISESGHHLLALINDILDLAKIEAGQITLDINKVDIHSVCQASLRMIKQLAQKKNQEVILQIEDGLGLMWADERRLKQMIVNLLGNAVKFTPENGKIGLEVHGDQEANKITITVWDNGIGIKPDDLARLFQPFVQLDSGLAREATGTGLGLALVAQMARLHGGSVKAWSDPGQGSRFSIILPWEPALAMDAATRLRITGKFRAIKPDEVNKPVILLVEDTQEVVMMIRDYLELAGYKLVTAQDGLDALVQAKLTHPNLILMDVQMPRMDGLEATRRLRSEAEFRYTPIIALTALAMPHDRERCLEAGMDEYISKPINLKALVKIIQSCLYNHEEPAAR